jgi:trehalose 6-phosphate synthase/phosphatase
MVGELNGDLGTPEWTPVIYLRQSVSPPELAALYAAADIAWVSPLRDGMNIVGKEYVACQGAGGGVLVISEFAGAAREMAEAIRVNPYDAERSAEAIDRALNLAEDERHERQAALLSRVQSNSATAWSDRFISRLRAAAEERGGQPVEVLEPRVTELRTAFRTASQRTILLDYDGTLVPLASRPADAIPTEDALEVLGALVRLPRTTVAIVSGRSQGDIDRWFGAIPQLWLAAEHGSVIREPGESEWRLLRPGADTQWKERVRPVLEDFARRAPGSLVEEKRFGLAWHYRLTDPEFGDWIANELATTLDEQLSGTELAVLHGNKVVEVRFAWANKGEVATHVLALSPPAELLLAVGDDRTDEELFDRLSWERPGPGTWTIKVGGGPTRAGYRLPGPPAVLSLLAALAATGRRRRPRG